MRTVIAILLLVPVATIKIVLVILGLIVVPLTWGRDSVNQNRHLPPLYRIGSGRPHTMWEAIVRNPVGGFGWLLNHPDASEVITYGEVREPHETKFVNGAKVGVPRIQWRLRRFRILCSVRLLWKYSGTRYGELYIGWKLMSAPPELDFGLSLRPWAEVGN